MAPARIKPQGIFEIYTDFKKRQLYTKSLANSTESHFGERIIKDGGKVYRAWDAKRSKLAAYVLKGSPNTGIREGSVVLYLGASHGNTPSYVSDMVGKEGFVFCLDFAPRVVRDLVFLCKKRENMAPIMGDAHHPKTYADRVSEVDVVFQDIAQKDQAGIFLKNVRMFLKDGGVGLLAVKAKSINIKKDPKQIFAEVRDEIGKEFMITDMRGLEPFELDHAMIVIKKRPPVEEANKSVNTGSRRSSSRRRDDSRSSGSFKRESSNRRDDSRNEKRSSDNNYSRRETKKPAPRTRVRRSR
ncbi:fibrillarin-like rRNA/tRNA 2'-O-methyltransferase [archaeon]|jgi:fibrillarin-like pre-rRNA processing protein|nr:fibrillarin-like rRNA/tRNA 2'-O-methyltransferase [archaeon]MBT6761938.1 fibrillarin-like rRNA/tRNA 2'-O-methyltransferase [archaeon]